MVIIPVSVGYVCFVLLSWCKGNCGRTWVVFGVMINKLRYYSDNVVIVS